MLTRRLRTVHSSARTHRLTTTILHIVVCSISLSAQYRCLMALAQSETVIKFPYMQQCTDNVQRLVCVSHTSNTVTNSCQVHVLLQAPYRPGVSSNTLSMNSSCFAFHLQQTKSQAVVKCPHMLNVPCRQGGSSTAQSVNSVCVACHLHQTQSHALVKCPYMLQVPCRPRVSSSVQSMNNVCVFRLLVQSARCVVPSAGGLCSTGTLTQ